MIKTMLCFNGCLLMLANLHANASDNWQCTARDATDKEWTRSGNYQRSAVNNAFEACKKESIHPATCKTSDADCESFMNGLSTRPMWRCIALDQMAKSWESNLYSQRDDAALAAKAYCQDRSNFPDTCYINLMTCKNVNLREE